MERTSLPPIEKNNVHEDSDTRQNNPDAHRHDIQRETLHEKEQKHPVLLVQGPLPHIIRLSDYFRRGLMMANRRRVGWFLLFLGHSPRPQRMHSATAPMQGTLA